MCHTRGGCPVHAALDSRTLKGTHAVQSHGMLRNAPVFDLRGNDGFRKTFVNALSDHTLRSVASECHYFCHLLRRLHARESRNVIT